MPGFDRTGPWGIGPRTGWGRGFCGPGAGGGRRNWGSPFMYGAGRGGIPWGGGRGRAWGGGRGWRWRTYPGAPWGYPPVPYAPAYGPQTPYGPSAEVERAALQKQIAELREELSMLEKRLEELSQAEGTQE